MQKSSFQHPVWLEVDLSAVAHNMREIRRIVKPEAQILAIVKANAYGHGAETFAREVLKHGANKLGVATLGEAVELRKSGIKEAPIVVLGYIPYDIVDTAISYDITQTVYTLEGAEAISKAAVQMGKKAIIHIKIDTGMGRIGFLPGPETLRDIKKIMDLPGLFVEGIYTHFAVADHGDKSFTLHQLEKFTELTTQLSRAGINFPIKHAANSAAVIDIPESHFDMVRPGIIMYGLYPSKEVNKKKIELKPAMTLKAQVSFVKKVAPGFSVSYGRKFITSKDTIIASLPLGYADGYARMLSNQAQVLIGGKRVAVAGMICMDQFMVDATDVPGVRIGDEAVLFGVQGNEEISVEELAQRLNTINYEVICMLSARIPRVYINEK